MKGLIQNWPLHCWCTGFLTMLRAGMAKRKSFHVVLKDLFTAKLIATSIDAHADWPARQAESSISKKVRS